MTAGSSDGLARVRKQQHSSKQPQFDGRVKALKGHVYDSTGSLQIGQYETTTMRIMEYVRSTFGCFGAETARAIETMTIPVLELELPPEASGTCVTR